MISKALYILCIRLGFNSKIVNNCTNDNGLILPTMTDKCQTRPLVERAPHMDRTVTFKQEETSGHEPQDRLTDCHSQCDFDFDNEFNCQLSSAREAVKIEPEHVKLKNLHC
jgi:hypothetical protein